jgi:methionine sulfoxide reductase heme-binding subunit
MTVWIIARSVGFAALLLLTASVCVGAAVSGGGRRDARRLIGQYVHRCLAAMGLLALAIHIGAILADSFAHVGVLGALVPLQSAYRPLAVGLGTTAVYCTLLVAVTGWARGRLAHSVSGARSWRAVHLLAYAGWAAAMVHGLSAGSDAGTPWARVLYLGCLGAVVGALAVRTAALFAAPLLRRGKAGPATELATQVAR